MGGGVQIREPTGTREYNKHDANRPCTKMTSRKMKMIIYSHLTKCQVIEAISMSEKDVQYLDSI
jgi:hypothetical protein